MMGFELALALKQENVLEPLQLLLSRAGTILMAMEGTEESSKNGEHHCGKAKSLHTTPLILPAALGTLCRKTAGEQEEEKGRQELLGIGTSLCDPKSSIWSGLFFGKGLTKGDRGKSCTILRVDRVNIACN